MEPARALPDAGTLEAIAASLANALAVVQDLNSCLSRLDKLMLTGQPHDIQNAAGEIEQRMQEAQPVFAAISAAMTQMSARSFDDAAAWLRASEALPAARLAEELRASLAQFSRKSGSAKRRASQLHRGLNVSLRALQSLGMHESGRLIAEA
ncbi:MAG TPA: hypothetical protein VMH92_00060 [Acidocella sp.]|nr:hypothetical protein [Acidocella sp.]